MDLRILLFRQEQEAAAEKNRKVTQASKADERRKANRYTIKEAETALCQGIGASAAPGVASAISKAAARGVIACYMPGKLIKHEGTISDWIEFYGDDLNRWLEAEQPRITWRFHEAESIKRALTDIQEKEIAEKYRGGTSVAALAKEYGVARTTIDRALVRQGIKVTSPTMPARKKL